MRDLYSLGSLPARATSNSVALPFVTSPHFAVVTFKEPRSPLYGEVRDAVATPLLKLRGSSVPL